MNRLEMNPYLMGPSRFRTQLEESVPFYLSNHFIVCEGIAETAFRSGLCAPETEVSARTANSKVNNAIFLFRHTMDECEIRLLHFSIMKCFAQSIS